MLWPARWWRRKTRARSLYPLVPQRGELVPSIIAPAQRRDIIGDATGDELIQRMTVSGRVGTTKTQFLTLPASAMPQASRAGRACDTDTSRPEWRVGPDVIGYCSQASSTGISRNASSIDTIGKPPAIQPGPRADPIIPSDTSTIPL